MVRDDREMIQFTEERMVPIACGSDASAWAAIVGMSASAAGLCRMCRRRLGERAKEGPRSACLCSFASEAAELMKRH